MISSVTIDEWFSAYYSFTKMQKLRSSVDRLNHKIIITEADLDMVSNHCRKPAIKAYQKKIAYLSKQRDSILDLYPEYFI